MKKLIAVLLLVMTALALRAGEETINYLTSGGKTYFCQKVRSGLFCANIVTSDGFTLKIPYSKVDSYFCKGKLYERLPVIYEGAAKGKTALMEYVTSRNGLRLYKYCEYGECGDLLKCNYQPAHLQVVYYVFKDGEFYLLVDCKNAATVLPFFGIKVI
ncbi:hypothetical protein TBC1_111846 [Lentimicrobium saccharophilum]|uniref:Uncharacterized protein n=1 Tax=Lentimicrobium saccharophilum TaxID=1678841 RepID=A0A0S7C3L2_9BACT|nr:hypothetical protein [Lentimicrobium saccharophilum]GAP43689.1 hypothetical protein TBC1_111846 [Lentimicrobium saccharophilum]